MVKLIEPQLDDPARVEEIYRMMLPVWEATSQDDRMYNLRQRAFENLTAYRQGTFTLFAEKKEPVTPKAVQEPQKAYDLGFGHLGNGLTVWNRLEEVDGGYRTVAHIAPDRTVQIYDEGMPQEVRDRIQQVADSSEMTVSATQNAPVFSVPPKEEPPKKEQPADLYPTLAAQVLRLMGKFDGSRMGYGEDDAQAVANIAQQLHNTAQRQEIRALLQSFLDHTDLEEEIASDVALCMEQINELNRSNIWRDMKTLCESAGVEPGKVFPHNLRHLFARTYYAIEKDLSRLADILGHTNVTTTRIYTAESGAVHARQIGRLGLVVT